MFIPISDDLPTVRPPILTVTVIVVCTVVFLYQLGLPRPLGELLIQGHGLTPAVFVGKTSLPFYVEAADPIVSMVTSMFLHGGIAHIVGNMLYLWVFGNNVEDAMGHTRFLIFYLLCGIAAALTQVLFNSDSTVPMVGASGAISGVLGAYFVLHPTVRIKTLLFLGIYFRFFRIPANILLGIWIALQILAASMAEPGEPGVAWFAHIGGFAAGVALVHVFRDPDIPLWGKRHYGGPWG